MLYTYKTEPQTLTIGSPVVLNQNGVQAGCTVEHEVGSPSIELKKAGLYAVNFAASLVGTATGVATVQVTQNGNNVNGAIIGQSVVVGITNNVAHEVIIRVRPNCCQNENIPSVLQFILGGVSTTFTNVVVTVNKIA